MLTSSRINTESLLYLNSFLYHIPSFHVHGVDGIVNTIDLSLSKLWEIVKTRKPGVLHAVHGVTNSCWHLNNNLDAWMIQSTFYL